MRLSTAILVPAALALSVLAAPPGIAADATGTGGISGTVTSATTTMPIAGVHVDAISTTAADPSTPFPHVGYANTADDGSYTIAGLPVDHTYVVVFSMYGSLYMTEFYDNSYTSEQAKPVSVADGRVTSDINAALEDAGRITGHVRTTGGAPIERVNMCAIPAETTPAVDACTDMVPSDDTGAYQSVALLPGDYWVLFIRYPTEEVQYYPATDDPAQAVPVTVTLGATTTDIDAVFNVSATDVTPPTIGVFWVWPLPNADGWNSGAVTIDWVCTDLESGPIQKILETRLEIEGVNQSATGICEDRAGNTSPSNTVGGIDIDLTDPVITHVSTLPAANAAGWRNAPVTATWTCTDALSGPLDSSVSLTTDGSGPAKSLTGICVDHADRWASDTVSGINVDLVDPTLTWAGAIADGDAFLFGTVPVAPTCTSVDGLSGPGTCQVTGYGTSVGDHTLVARALDRAGNETTESRTYTVRPWTMLGFRAPVTMGEWNVMRAGANVPLKFEVFADTTELTTIAAISDVSVRSIPCSSSSTRMTAMAAPATGLHYDAKGGYFAVDLKLPKAPGTCVAITATAADGSTLSVPIALR